MMHLFVLLMTFCLVAGCSKKEESKSEQLGQDMADQMQKPINDARAVYEKARKTRDVEMPQ